MTVLTTYLGTTPEPVLVHHHAPEDPGPAARPAVIIVPPFAWDEVASYRIRREWAIRLARDGHHVLRLDLPGTGDSAGGPRDPDRLGAWVAATGQAAAWLREQAGGTRVAALGLGTGGVVAWLAAAGSHPIDDLMLWNVPGRGRHVVRELQAFSALKASEWGDVTPDDQALPDGWLDVSGYVMSAETTRALSAVRLDATPLPRPDARRALLIGRDGTLPDERLRAALAEAGADVAAAVGQGWGAMTQGPQEAEMPLEVIGLVDEWLARAGPDPVVIDSRALPAALARLELGDAAERPWTAQRRFGRQFGILATPAPAPDGPAPIGLLLLNGGAVRHTGPNRMWVEVARRQATRGVPVMRADIEGLGDSDGDGRPYVDSAKLYAPELAAQVAAICAELVRAGVAERWVVAGLCAGASWAFHAALEDPRHVAAAVLVNPFAFWWEDQFVVERDADAARAAGYGPVIRRLAGGDIQARRVLRAAWHAARMPLQARRRRHRARERVERIDQALDRLRDAGVPVTLALGRGEPMALRMERDGLVSRLPEWPNLSLCRLPARDHTFRAPWLQSIVHGLLDEAVAGAADRRPAPAHPAA